MESAYVDPQELREFAHHLKDMASTVSGLVDDLSAQVHRLGSSWEDQEYDAFVTELQKTQGWLRFFAEETEKVVPSLERDADTMQQYQRIQVPR